ncbi:MAG: hypothetical protein LPK49_00385, partial [Bacteroidota bacterium]|nr:hypothetical protein [Bacteroidota bacterium]MDX5429476.1 hypothetical protein [Bacteroidota bacterium]
HVIKNHHGGLLTWDGTNVILKNTTERTQGTKKPEGKKEIEDRKKREENLRYRGAMEEAEEGAGTEFRIVACGMEATNYSSIWRVTKMSDLGGVLRLCGLSGMFNLYAADEYGGDPKAIAINPSGSDQIYQLSVWY